MYPSSRHCNGKKNEVSCKQCQTHGPAALLDHPVFHTMDFASANILYDSGAQTLCTRSQLLHTRSALVSGWKLEKWSVIRSKYWQGAWSPSSTPHMMSWPGLQTLSTAGHLPFPAQVVRCAALPHMLLWYASPIARPNAEPRCSSNNNAFLRQETMQPLSTAGSVCCLHSFR